MHSLYKLYLGEVNVVPAAAKHAMAPERLRVHVVKALLKSGESSRLFPASLQVALDLLRDEWKSVARVVAFDWLNHLRAHSQINAKCVPLLLDRIVKILSEWEPDDRLFNLIPHLIELNEAAFDPKLLNLFEILLESLKSSPGATTPIIARDWKRGG